MAFKPLISAQPPAAIIAAPFTPLRKGAEFQPLTPGLLSQTPFSATGKPNSINTRPRTVVQDGPLNSHPAAAILRPQGFRRLEAESLLQSPSVDTGLAAAYAASLQVADTAGDKVVADLREKALTTTPIPRTRRGMDPGNFK